MICHACNCYRVARAAEVFLKGSKTKILVTNVAYNSTRVATQNLRVKKKVFGPMAIFLLSIPVSSFGLGLWQIQRKKWKEDLIENLMVKTKIPPIPLPENDDEIKALDFRAVTVQGVFDHSHELYLGPRSCLIDGESKQNQGKLISSSADGVSGYLIVTPFILSDTKEKILVNRGWVPFKKKKPLTRKEGQIEEEVELTGIIRVSEPRQKFSPLNKLDVRVWFSRDVETMAEFVGSRPVFIDATADSTVPGGPIGGQTRSNIRNEHTSYIITWFCLSATTAVMWYFRYVH